MGTKTATIQTDFFVCNHMDSQYCIEMYCVFYMIKICIYGKDRVAKITELCYNDIEYFVKMYQYYLVVLISTRLVKLGTLQLQAGDLLKLQISFNSVIV